MHDHDSHEKKQHTLWELCVDGASRNNPGPAGAGVFIKKNGSVFKQAGYYLGTKTNNQAEYLALLIGLFLLEKYAQAGDNVRVVSDSELLVKQINGQYRVKQEQLKPLHALASLTVEKLGCVVTHVLRDENTHADELANQGIDKKITVPEAFIQLLERHAITF